MISNISFFDLYWDSFQLMAINEHLVQLKKISVKIKIDIRYHNHTIIMICTIKFNLLHVQSRSRLALAIDL